MNNCYTIKARNLSIAISEIVDKTVIFEKTNKKELWDGVFFNLKGGLIVGIYKEVSPGRGGKNIHTINFYKFFDGFPKSVAYFSDTHLIHDKKYKGNISREWVYSILKEELPKHIKKRV